MRDGNPPATSWARLPYVEASVGIYNIFKLLHIEYVKSTDLYGHTGE